MGQCEKRSEIAPQLNPQLSSPVRKGSIKKSTTGCVFIVEELRHFPPLPKKTVDVMEMLTFSKGNNLLQPQKQKQNESLNRTNENRVSNDNYRVGIFKLEDGNVYQGTIQDDKFKGRGKLLLPDNTFIQSHFENNQPSLSTRIIRKNGDYFNGNISVNGTYGEIFEKGIKYNGEIFQSKPHGEGQQVSQAHFFKGKYSHGEKVSGLMKVNIKDTKSVKSTLSTQSFKKSQMGKLKEEEYQGEFLNGLFHGQGTLINFEGKYVGKFEKGLKNGHGIMEYWDGRKFEGNFIDNYPEKITEP